MSILNGFLKFFHCWKARQISNETRVILPTIRSVYYRTTSRNLEVWTCGNFQKNLKIVSHLTKKTKTSLVIWLNIVTIVARSVCFWPASMSKDVHATRHLHCQSWSGQCHAKHGENAASVLDTCLDKIVRCSQSIFNRNWKLKQQVSQLNALQLGVSSKIKVVYVFICIFFQICQNSELLTFAR